jgi:PPP family 3-phenylpropionic acid transporter
MDATPSLATSRVVTAPAGLIICYISYFFYLGTATPYYTLWLADRGLNPGSIAMVGTAVLLGATIGQAGLSYCAMLFGLRVTALLASVAALLATVSLYGAHSISSIAAASAVAGLFAGSIIPLIDAMALSRPGIDYGHIRAWGSGAFAVAAVTAGWLIDFEGGWVVIPIELAALAVLGIGMAMIGPIPTIDQVPEQTSDRRQFWSALRSPALWLLMISVALINASHAYYYLFSDLYWSDHLNYGKTQIGFLWTSGLIAEVLVLRFLGGGTSMQWALGLILSGAAAAMIRWTCTAFDPPLALLFLIQLLHGFSFAATILGGLTLLRRIVDPAVLPAVLGLFAALVHGVVIGAVTALLGTSNMFAGSLGCFAMVGVAALGGLGVLIFPCLPSIAVYFRAPRFAATPPLPRLP